MKHFFRVARTEVSWMDFDSQKIEYGKGFSNAENG